LLGWTAQGWAQSFQAQLDKVHEDISNWQMPEAREGLDKLAAEGHEDDPHVLFARGYYEFYKGDYKQSLALIDQAMVSAPADDKQGMGSLRKQVEVAYDVTKNYKEFYSPDKRFLIRVEPGRTRSWCLTPSKPWRGPTSTSASSWGTSRRRRS
jgi:hypothetical protein